MQKVVNSLLKKILFLLLLFIIVVSNSHANSDSSKKHFFHFFSPISHLKIPFKKNKLKYIDTISSTSSNFRLDEIQSRVIKTTTYPVPVGFNDFEENLRDIQLLGIIPSNNAFTNRPYYLNTQLTYDSLLKLIDTSIKYGGYLVKKKSFEVRLTPFNILQKFTSDRPYGYNDGPLNYSNGYQFLVSGGIAMRWKFISLQLRPEFFKTASENYETGNGWGAITNSMTKIIPGQTSLNLNFGAITISAASQNLWMGPGNENSLILSNNAKGFNHLEIRNNKNISTIFGTINFSVVSGILTRMNNQTNEIWMEKSFYPNVYFRPQIYNSNIPYPLKRYINVINFNFSPKFLPNSNFGFIRMFQNYIPANSFKELAFVNEYLPVFNGIFRTSYTDDEIPRDQKLSFYSRFNFQENKASIFFEFLYNDGVVNFRDLILRSQRSSAYNFGFQKIFEFNSKKFLKLSFESIRIAELPNYLVSYAGTIYEHGKILEGYTHDEQIIGAGVGNGNNAQQISLTLHNRINKFGIKFEHISQGPINYINDYFSLGIRKTLWDDYRYCFENNFSLKKNIILKSQLSYIKSRNYLWIENNKKNNIFLLINLIYLW